MKKTRAAINTKMPWTSLTLPHDLRPAKPLLLTDKQPTVQLRDGEVVLYKRPGTLRWQCRFRLREIGWVQRSTRTANLEIAALTACDWYDEARFRSRLGLAPEVKRFDAIAAAALQEMRRDLGAGTGKRIYRDYCQVIERYFVEFFGKKYLQNITAAEIAAFEAWRNQRLGRQPAKSTLLTFAAAWTRIIDLAVQRGWISAHTPIPRLTTRGGLRAKSRPAFRREEIQQLRQHMEVWCTQVVAKTKAQSQEIRLLLRDYVELLLFTGMRHGTEAMRVQWRHFEWHRDGERKYLRLWVSGKTGERWLIAKHEAVAVLQRLALRDPDCAGRQLDEIFAAKLSKRVFSFSDGTQPYHFNKAFERLLRSADLLLDSSGDVRTLYSLRHTYATLELAAGTDLHTLARQMGTSVVMLEKFYSKLTATLQAEQLT
jgi:integrase